MSEVVDERVRESVRTSTPETKESVLRDLLDQILADHANAPTLHVVTAARALREALDRLADGQGYPPPTPEQLAEVEQNREYIRRVLKLTPEQEAEYERREATLDDVLEVDEVIRQLREAAPLGTPSR